MLLIKAKESQFSKYHVFFSAKVIGNMCQFARYECMERGFWSAVFQQDGSDIRSQLRLQTDNLSDWETFTMLDNLSNIVYHATLAKIDVDYEKNKKLLSFSK